MVAVPRNMSSSRVHTDYCGAGAHPARHPSRNRRAWCRVDAVDGRASLSDETGAPRRVRQALSPLEIACARSHLCAYKSIADHQIPVALVFEDDALLGYQFLQVTDRLLPLVDPARPQAILLSHVVRYSAWAAQRVDKIHRLCRPYEAYGAHAYLITLAG